MPRHESDRDDPLELNGAVVPCDEDNDEAMAEAFVEEFMHMGFTRDRILALFRLPVYLGPHRVFRSKGEAHVRALVDRTLSLWA